MGFFRAMRDVNKSMRDLRGVSDQLGGLGQMEQQMMQMAESLRAPGSLANLTGTADPAIRQNACSARG
jgi:hypothetical protein